MARQEERALPIDALREQFFQWAQSTRPFVLQAPTGSGKSTRLPQWWHEAHGRCLVVEPRRMACNSLASYLARQRQEKVGDTIGVCMRGLRAYGSKTRILFVTPGIAIRMLASRDPWTEHVLVDEFHERSLEMDLLITSLRQRAGIWGVTSATIAGEQWSRKWDAEWMVAAGRSFPVTCHHDAAWSNPSRQNLEERVAAALDRAIQEHDTGDILVFLPGMREILGSLQASRVILQRNHLQASVAHSTLGMHSIDALFDSSARRRVYFATNVAETSVTFPNIRVVIDGGLERRIVHRGGRAVLLLHPVSADSAEQRKGRAGRVAPGHCYRLYRTTAALEPHTPPEIERTPLDDMCCQAAACGIDLSSPGAAPWPTPPPKQAFEEAIARLQRGGILDENRNLSDKGRLCSAYSTSVQYANLLVDAHPELLPQLSALVALLDAGRGCLHSSPDDDQRSEREKYFHGLQEIEQEVALFFLDVPKRMGIDEQRYENLCRVRMELLRQSKQHNHPLGLESSAPASFQFSEVFLRHLMSRSPEFCFAKRERSEQKNAKEVRAHYGNGHIELSCEVEHALNHDEKRQLPRFAMIFQQRWQMRSEGHAPTGVGTWWVPVDCAWLMAENIGSSVTTEVEWMDKSKSPTIRQETQLAGISMGAQLRHPSPSELHEWVAAELRKSVERLHAGASPARVWRAEVALGVQSALRVWEAWAFCEGHPRPPAWQEFLVHRLQALGVEDFDDLDLLSLEDWLPPLESLCGVPKWEQEKWLSDFPLRWSYEGGWYRCDLEEQCVVLRPTDAKSKKQKSVPAQLVPRFRDKTVFLQHASRKIRIR